MLHIIQFVYLILLGVYAFVSGIGLYHAFKYGFQGDATKPMAILYCVVSFILIYFSAKYVFWAVDWDNFFL